MSDEFVFSQKKGGYFHKSFGLKGPKKIVKNLYNSRVYALFTFSCVSKTMYEYAIGPNVQKFKSETFTQPLHLC